MSLLRIFKNANIGNAVGVCLSESLFWLCPRLCVCSMSCCFASYQHINTSQSAAELLRPGASLSVENKAEGEDGAIKVSVCKCWNFLYTTLSFLMEITHENDTLTWHIHEGLCMLDIHLILMA